jgi:uncharacterized protein
VRIEQIGAVRVTWSDRGEAPSPELRAEIERLVRELVGLGAVRVVLFGSRARGAASSSSDVDLLAVLPSPPPGPFPRRLAAVYEALQPRLALDLLVYTPAELARLRGERRFIRDILDHGEVLYGE